MREHLNPLIGHSSSDKNDYRLPKNVKPTHYDIRLEPDFENASLNGSVVVHFDVLQDTNFIILNTHEIEILTTVLISSPGKAVKIPKVHFHEVQQTMVIPLPETVPEGAQIRIQQTFKGRLNDAKTMSGFNRSRYIGRDGKQKWIGSTQGQPVGARQIFPCADEPAFKATFAATLVVDHGVTALSNMDISSEKSASNTKKAVVFNKTPPMSTYLVCFVVAELDYIESKEYRVPVRIYATPDQDLEKARWLLDISAKAMISHEKIFGSPYPLPKLDSVSVPGHAGGMENWGCVLYADTYLCADESDGSAAGNVRKAYVVTHELAHQWFGNIVTAEWWDSLWLNESFADWATYNAATHMWPEWHPWSEFVSAGGQAYQAALALDSNRQSHRIENPVNTPAEIAQSFDAITYAKGCAILRMISELLGNEVFVKGVRLHLKRHAFGNATTDDLWDSLSHASGKNVQKIMSTWTQKVGFPILYVTEDQASNTISISQHRFLQSGKVLPEDDQVLYPVHLKTRTLQGIDHDVQLVSRTGKFPVNLATYKLNAGQTGLYRVSYPLSRWAKLGSQLRLPNLLTGDDRVGLISDLSAIATAGQTSTRTSHLLSFLSNFKAEKDYFVWRQLFSNFEDLQKAWLFEDASTIAALKRFQQDLMKKVLGDLDEELWNFKPWEEYSEQGLKATIFANAEAYGPVKIVASYLFKRFMDGDTKALNPNIRQAVFKIVLSDAKASDQDETYNQLLHTFRTTPSVNTRTDVISALSHATSPSLIQRTISLVNSPEIQSLNERISAFAALSTHCNGIFALWEWLKENWDELVDKEGGILGGAFVGSCVQGFATREQVREVEGFLRGKKGSAEVSSDLVFREVVGCANEGL
ncbi:lysine aminopeptidase [Hyaloscypha variabilis F]|uniref:Aminopeptidase n=1 Tax=Hyaloscypha variabilis (strain UAMH 11265 / GT02V1 / F) TaxID=1149755 RepID=A0A2J6RRL3_HYAVF|nr:lysine aminopeptidase [Hyaloscypha variabilis F]